MPKGEVQLSLLAHLDWFTPAVEFVGGAWIVRPVAAGGSFNFDTGSQRFITVASETSGAGLSGDPANTDVAIRMPRTIEITGLWILMNGAFGVGESATFQFNVDGVTNAGLSLSFVNGDTKKGASGSVNVPLDSLLCLECTAVAGATPPGIISIGVKYRLAPGSAVV